MNDRRIPKVTLVAVMVALLAALVARTLIRLKLAELGYDAAFARDLSYLVVPIVLVLLLFPIWSSEKSFVVRQFRRVDLSWPIALSAIAIGVLLRASWWSHLVAALSFGLYATGDPGLIEGPRFSFQCPPHLVLALGFLVMAVMIPIIEELVHRTYVLTALQHRGFVVSVFFSAIVFAIFHRYASIPFALFAGLVLGTQYWITKSLWPSVIAHATVNGLIQIDWRCLSGHWNPRADAIPIMIPGVVATISLLTCLLGIYYLLNRMAIGAQRAPIASG